MRTFLDRLYTTALVLSAAGFAAIAALVLFQVAGRVIDRFARLAGVAPPGLTVPSLAELGGFLFVGAVTLGFAGTFVRGGHVRVSLLTQALSGAARQALAAAAAAAAGGLAAFATWSSWLQALDSWAFDSVSFGMLRVPLWLPQGVMTLGLALLTVALVDALCVLLQGGRPAYAAGETETGGEG